MLGKDQEVSGLRTIWENKTKYGMLEAPQEG